VSWGSWIAWSGSSQTEPPPSARPVSIQQLEDELFSPRPPLIVDLRFPQHFAAWHVSGSINVPNQTRARALIEERLATSPARKIAVICYGGARSSALVAAIVAEHDPEGVGSLSSSVRHVERGYYGLSGFGAPHRFKAIRSVPERLAALWVSRGAAVRADVSSQTLLREPELQQLRQRLTETAAPLAIYASDVSPEQVESHLGREDSRARFYVVPESQHLKSPPLLLGRLGLSLEQWTGGAWRGLLLLFLIQAAVLCLVRRREVLLGLDGRGRGLRWLGLVLPLGFVLVVIEVADASFAFHGTPGFATPTPFDMENLVVLFMLLTAIGLWLQLANPPERRKETLVEAIRQASRGGPSAFPFALRWNTGPLWAFVLMMAVGVFQTLPVMLFVIAGLYLLIGIDLALWKWSELRLFRARSPERLLLRWAGIRLVPGESAMRLFTRSEEHPGCLRLETRDGATYVGVFSGRAKACSEATGSPPNEDEARHLVELAARVRALLCQDARIDLDARGGVTGVDALEEAATTSSAVHEEIMSLAASAAPEALDTIRLDATPFEEALEHPTPLALEILRRRWDRAGGAVRSLRAFWIKPRRQNRTGEHLVSLGSHLYKDLEAEARLFEAGRASQFVRRVLVKVSVELAAATAEDDFTALVEPRARKRLRRLRRALAAQHVSETRLVKSAYRALARLSGEAALWQEKVAFVHGRLYLQLEEQLAKRGLRVVDLPLDPSPAKAVNGPEMPYELYRTEPPAVSSGSDVDPDLPKSLRDRIRLWRAIEVCKQRARELYLEELALAGALLDRAGAATGIAGDAPFLELREIRRLHRRRWRGQLRLLARQRKARWLAGRDLALPSRLSLLDLEQLRIDGTDAASLPEASEEELAGIRVAGRGAQVAGTVRVMETPDPSMTLQPHEILVTARVTPQWIAGAGTIRGIVTEQGGMLSHAAILARELGIFTIMRVPHARRRLADGERVLLTSDGSIGACPPATDLWLPLERSVDAPGAGEKARHLALLMDHGFPVPQGAVLTYKAFQRACEHWDVEEPVLGGNPGNVPAGLLRRQLPREVVAALDEIARATAGHPGGWIVRSSSGVEDLPGRSFAGLFHSQTASQEMAALVDAVCECWKSAWNRDLSRYGGEATRGRPVALNLIIQDFIDGNVGGTLFTQNPVDSDGGSLVIEASPDGARGAVDGRVAVRLVVARTGERIQQAGPADLLEPRQVKELCDFGLRIEKLFGCPQDIEWVIADSRLYFLQAREISS
jgi:phosphohistidine swiveling domain-containing protein/rhodanese-related sulfurtransferase